MRPISFSDNHGVSPISAVAALRLMITPRKQLVGALVLLLSPLALSQPSTSDASTTADTGARALEEVVVTAQRREQRLQDVGIAVSTYSSEQLRELGLATATDLAQWTPGVFVAGTLGGQTQQFTIRGVTQSDYNDALEAPVAVYIDEMYIPAQQGQMLALFDIDRVEVLKGPQGTLFGRNATGGLVNTIVNLPNTEAVGGHIGITFGRFNEVRSEGAINLPISSTAAVRLSGYYSEIDDFWKNRAGDTPGTPQNFGPPGMAPSPCCEDLGGNRTYAGRAQLLLTPSEELSVRLVASGTRQKMSTAPYTAGVTIGHYDAQGRYVQSDYAGGNETRLAIGPDGGNFADFNILQFARFATPGDGTRLQGSTWFGYQPLDPDDLELSADFAKQGQNVVSSHAAAAHVHYSLGDIDIASITAYQRHSKHMMMDADGSPANLFLFGTRARTTAFSQEVRLSGGDEGFYWTGGVYYLDLDTRATQGLLGAQGSLFGAAFGFAGVGVDVNRDPDLNTRSLSAFGQVEIGLADRWTLVAGGRIIRERQEYDLVMNFYRNDDDYKVDRNAPVRPYNPPFSDKRNDTLWAGKLQLEYRPTENLLTYAGVNRGVKGGSYNAPGIGALSQAEIPFDAETLVSYEAGMKFSGVGYALNMEAFWYDYDDYQAFLFSSASGIVQNVDSEVYGFAADIRMNATSNLSVSLGGSYTHAEIPDFEVAPGVFRTVRPAYAPRRQISASVNYEIPAHIAGGRMGLNAHANYASGFYHNLRNFDGHWFDSRTIVNFSASWQQDTSGLRLTAYLNNAFDERYGLIGFDNTPFCGCSLESYGPPRTYGLTVGYEF